MKWTKYPNNSFVYKLAKELLKLSHSTKSKTKACKTNAQQIANEPLRELNIRVDGYFIFGSHNDHTLVHIIQLSLDFDSLVEKLFLKTPEKDMAMSGKGTLAPD